MGYKEVFKKNAPDTSFTLSKNMVINGNVSGDVSGRIEGHILGNVFVNGKVVLAETGVIEGDISGSDVVVQGTVKGNIIASTSLHVEPQGMVMGSVTSLSIFVDSQAIIKGTIHKITSKSEIELLISENIDKIKSSFVQKNNSVDFTESITLQNLNHLPLNSLQQDPILSNHFELDLNSDSYANKENDNTTSAAIKSVPEEEIANKSKVTLPPKAPDRWW